MIDPDSEIPLPIDKKICADCGPTNCEYIQELDNYCCIDSDLEPEEYCEVCADD